MKTWLIAGGLVLVVSVATGTVTTDLSSSQEAALTTIDSVPTRAQLQNHELVVPDDLITISAQTSYEPGVRLRAIHGLAVYCTSVGVTCPDLSPAHTALVNVVKANTPAQAGADLLVLRAAIESLGPLRVPGDLGDTTGTGPELGALLNHPSRDIRAAAARALADLRNCNAVNALRIRYQNESIDQVKLVISETLRILSQPANCQ